MKRIRVNTEELKTKAKDFDTTASVFFQAGEEILTVAMSMPSYDGQLSGPARQAGYEIHSRSRELLGFLSSDSKLLQMIAHKFEEVDNQVIKNLETTIAGLAAMVGSIFNNLTETIFNDVGEVEPDLVKNRIYGYSRNPLTGDVTIWNNLTGEVIVFTAEELQNPIVKDNVDAFKRNIIDMNAGILAEGAAAIAIVAGIATGAIGLVAVPNPFTSIPALAAIGTGIIAFAAGVAVAVIYAPSLYDAVTGCNNMWNVLKIQKDNPPPPPNSS
jgi:energy-converting hydrogenase Eha subunit C